MAQKTQHNPALDMTDGVFWHASIAATMSPSAIAFWTWSMRRAGMSFSGLMRMKQSTEK